MSKKFKKLLPIILPISLSLTISICQFINLWISLYLSSRSFWKVLGSASKLMTFSKNIFLERLKKPVKTLNYRSHWFSGQAKNISVPSHISIIPYQSPSLSRSVHIFIIKGFRTQELTWNFKLRPLLNL